MKYTVEPLAGPALRAKPVRIRSSRNLLLPVTNLVSMFLNPVYVMWGARVLHDNVDSGVPAIGYWTCFVLCLAVKALVNPSVQYVREFE